MSIQNTNDPMLDMFIFETMQLIEQLEQSVLHNEEGGGYSQESINEIFRIMHTIKGSAAMMEYNGISTVAHSMEDIFFFMREEKPHISDYSSLTDIIFEGIDFIKQEMEKIKNGGSAEGEYESLTEKLKSFLSILMKADFVDHPNKNEEYKQAEISQRQYDAKLEKDNFFAVSMFFEDGCEMENIRAYGVINSLEEYSYNLHNIPENLFDDDASAQIIKQAGFTIYFNSKSSYKEIYDLLMETLFLKSLDLRQIRNTEELEQFKDIKQNHENDIVDELSNEDSKPIVIRNNISTRDSVSQNSVKDKTVSITTNASNHSDLSHQYMISVSIEKLDKLMDLVGEMVISEAMVVQNPDLNGLQLDNFHKAARQHHKITSELQDTVMSMRMVPISATFLKMHRMVRDISRKQQKEMRLKIIGEETEVDKNLIEHISDPLMHLVRNAMDHGIESPDERLALGKPKSGTILLEAKNSGSDVLIIVKDDGKGLNKEEILTKAKELNLLYKPEADMTDDEIFNLVLLPGFSTKDDITELSGRGVGMDVVSKNIATIGGSIEIESMQDIGTTITLKIPLTLAIIDGMNIRVGTESYTIPTMSIIESFRAKDEDVLTDPEGNEMIMVRGQCYSILRLHKIFNNKTDRINISEGIIIMTSQDKRTVCIFADELIGQQPVVVKSLPEYIRRFKKVKGLVGCTLLGDGTISLILDIARLTQLEGILF